MFFPVLFLHFLGVACFQRPVFSGRPLVERAHSTSPRFLPCSIVIATWVIATWVIAVSVKHSLPQLAYLSYSRCAYSLNAFALFRHARTHKKSVLYFYPDSNVELPSPWDIGVISTIDIIAIWYSVIHTYDRSNNMCNDMDIVLRICPRNSRQHDTSMIFGMCNLPRHINTVALRYRCYTVLNSYHVVCETW